MSREYLVLFVKANHLGQIDGQPAEVFMRFTEQPTSQFLDDLATSRPGERVYCLMGGSTWHEDDDAPVASDARKPICSADGCYRTESCGPFCRDNGNL